MGSKHRPLPNTTPPHPPSILLRASAIRSSAHFTQCANPNASKIARAQGELTAIPIFGLTLYTGLELRRLAALSAQDNALRVARLVAFEQGQTIEATRLLLAALAQVPSVRTGDTAACSALFAELLTLFPRYANFGVVDLNGDVTCSGLPSSGPVNISDRAYFQRALASRDFAVGDYQIGWITGKASINFGYPIFDARGEIQAVVFAALDLSWFNHLAAKAQLPPGSTLMVIDRNGAVLFRFPEPGGWVGQDVSGEPLVQTILAQGEGTTIISGVDDVPRLYGFAALVGAPQAGYVSVGIPRDIAFAEANLTLTRSLISLGIVFVLAIAVAWLSSDLFVLRPVRALMKMGQRLGKGDLSTRTGSLRGPAEIQRLAYVLDEMAASLQARALALAESEERFRLLAENVHDLICLHEPDGTYLYLSPSCKRLLGYAPDELVGTNPYDLFHPKDVVRIQTEAHEPALEGDVIRSIIYRIRRKSGEYIWFETHTQPILNDQGNVERLVTASRDITGRVEAEQALRRSNARLKTLHALDWSILTTQSLEVMASLAIQAVLQQTSVLGASITLFDFETQESEVLAAHSPNEARGPTGKRFSLQAFPDEDIHRLRQGQVQMTADIMSLPRLPPGIQFLREEGLRSYIRVPLIAQGELLGCFSLGASDPHTFSPETTQIAQEIADQLAIAVQHARYRDQIRRHMAELEQRIAVRTAELRRAKELVEILLNSSSDAIVLLAASCTVRQANQAFRQLFGYLEEDEVFGISLAALLTPEHADSLAQALQRVVEDQQPNRIEVLACSKSGRVFPVDVVLAPVAAADEEQPGVLCNIRDITEYKRAEETLRQALEREKTLSELQSRFTSMASHEFRGPLTVIQSSGDLLRRYGGRMSEAKKREYLDQIQAQVKRLVDLLNDTLLISKAENVGLALNPEPLNLEKLCRDLVRESQLVAGERHELVFSSKGKCTHVIVDGNLLRHAIGNLLSNAVKYLPEGGKVYLDLTCEDDGVAVRVKDEGIGIPEEDQKHLFEVFHRAGNVGNIPGTGLGLAIVKRAAEAHGGTITFASEAGTGTTFTLHLPLS